MTIEPTVEDANFKIIIRRQRHVNTGLSNFTTEKMLILGLLFICFLLREGWQKFNPVQHSISS